MKSGKSFELISYFLPLRYSNIRYFVCQSSRNVRDEVVWSRGGVVVSAQKVKNLSYFLGKKLKFLALMKSICLKKKI